MGLWFFTLFFSIIVADGGYGLLYLGLCLYLKYKFPSLKGALKRLLKLGTILATSCVIWGVLTSSFFGIDVSPKNALNKLSVVHYLVIKKADYHFAQGDDVMQEWTSKFPALKEAKNGEEMLDQATTKKGDAITYEMYDTFADNILLEFSLIIGVIHIGLALLRYLFRNWAGIGWLIFMVGAYLYFPSILNATSLIHVLGFVDKTKGTEIGLQLIYTGIPLALFLALLQRRLKGLGEIANLVQIFADVLSYLRLYALGLAGSIMAATFNEIGLEIGLFLGVLVIILGHSVNILLGVNSGVIHGLRLNFIEWYHYCFTGGGRLFRPLKRLLARENN